MRCKRHFHEPFKLFHISAENHDGEVFIPRPMDKKLVMDGENWKRPRICVSTSIDGAISAIADSISLPIGLKFWVHVPSNLDNLFKNHKVYRPSSRQVPDAEVTGEHWLTASASMQAIGQIEITGIDETQNLKYMWYGHETKIDRFKWKWINETVYKDNCV